VRALLVTLIASGCLRGQNIYFYSDLQYDASSGNASMYAQTGADYSSQYYYDVFVYMQLNVFPEGSSQYITCQRSASNGNADAYVSCSVNVGTGTLDLELISSHEITATYYTYQFDPYCDWSCYYWHDAFRMSFLGISGEVWESNQSYFAPGPPATPVPQRQTATGQIVRRRSNRACNFPASESSLFWQWSTWYPYAAGFVGLLQGGPSFTGRTVTEELTQLLGDTCWHQGSPYAPMYIPYSSWGTWTVGTLIGENGMVIGPSYNNYGLDFVGFTDATQVGYYQQRLRAGYYPAGQCGLVYQQHMYMDGCGGLKQKYWIQGLEMYIRPYQVEAKRSSVSATR
jgi:hypothetical protein